MGPIGYYCYYFGTPMLEYAKKYNDDDEHDHGICKKVYSQSPLGVSGRRDGSMCFFSNHLKLWRASKHAALSLTNSRLRQPLLPLSR